MGKTGKKGCIVKSYMRKGKMVKSHTRGGGAITPSAKNSSKSIIQATMPNPNWSIHSKEYKAFREAKNRQQ